MKKMTRFGALFDKAKMGAPHLGTGTIAVKKERRQGDNDGNQNLQTADAAVPAFGKAEAGNAVLLDPADVSELSTRSIGSINADEGDSSSIQDRQQERREKILEPSTLKRYRVNVPLSMSPGDIMTIKLGGDLTKILITTPTTCSHRPFNHDNQLENIKHKSLSHGTLSTATCSSTLSSSSTPCSERQLVDSKSNSHVVISSAAKIPNGKMLVHAKPVIVIHAEFSQTNQQLKDVIVEEVMQEIIQETINNGCNSILGLTVSIKAQKDYDDYYSGYVVKACGTPCLLMPAQVLLER
jgi:hypothetical protein